MNSELQKIFQPHQTLGEVINLLQFSVCLPTYLLGWDKGESEVFIKNNKNVFILRKMRYHHWPDESFTELPDVFPAMPCHKNPLSFYLYYLCIVSPLVFKKDTCKNFCTPKWRLNWVSRGPGRQSKAFSYTTLLDLQIGNLHRKGIYKGMLPEEMKIILSQQKLLA